MQLNDHSREHLDVVCDAFAAVLRPLISGADGVINYAELWAFTDLTFEASYISSYAIAAPGSHAGAGVTASELIFTFRTLEGGYMRVVLMETPFDPGPSLNYTDMGVAAAALCDYITTPATNHFLGRDTSSPFIVNKQCPGQNETLFKKRYRQ